MGIGREKGMDGLGWVGCLSMILFSKYKGGLLGVETQRLPPLAFPALVSRT